MAGEPLTEVDLTLPEADTAALGDGDGAVVKRAVELAQAPKDRTLRGSR